jgi:hypothetical protein
MWARLRVGRASFLALAGVSGALGFASACSSFDADPDPSTEDGSAASEAGDAGDTVDAPSDSAPRADAAKGDAASPCSAAHDFCADFDSVTNVANGWQVTRLGTGYAPAFAQPASAPSPPRVMQSQLELADAASGEPLNVSALLKSASISGGATRPRIDIDFDVFVAQAGVATNGTFVMRLFDPEVHIELWRSSSATTMTVRFWTSDGAMPSVLTPRTASITPEIGEWIHFSLHVPARVNEKVPIPITIKVGTKFTDSFELVATPLATVFDCELGLYTGVAGSAWTAQYDNIVMDWQ